MERIYFWDNLKFFAILCIVLLHSTMPYSKDGVLLFKYIRPFINLYPMTLFALISGYWYKDRTFKELLLLYLWPCLLFSIINNVLGFNSFFPHYVEDFSFKPGYAMWYLMALFLYSILTKWMRKGVSTTTYLIVVLLFAFAIGFFPIPNRFFDIQRTSCLFPCFAFGVWIRQSVGSRLLEWKSKRGVRVLCSSLFTLCVIFNLVIVHFNLNVLDSFTAYYGLNLRLAFTKWIMILLRVLACMCLILLFPNKSFWFTKFGSRTMNVYLLHAIPVFLICWGCLYNHRYEWYGVMSLAIGVPLLCTFLFSTGVNELMRKVLCLDYLCKLKQSRTIDDGQGMPQ